MKINYFTAARGLIALLFITSGVGMALGFSGTVQFFESLSLPIPQITAVLVILVKVVGGIVFFVGKKYSDEAAYALIAFTIGATLLAHMDFTSQMQITSMLKNVSIIGGLLACTKCVKGKA